ncbi:MAG: SDR family NAD(P)-dependent oxidoreductase [Planctomycetota bacterium]|nr:MAG: SDR family NAD(P)-dependent oxidoreductase [Planctomycetota bacterium]
MATVLVTGATGFIGAKLVERLAQRGDHVTCLVRATSNRASIERSGVRFIVGDVCDADSVRKAVGDAEVVYHLAGVAAAFHTSSLMEVNAEGFRNVAAACAACQPAPVLVSVSSLAAAGPSPPDRPRTESDPPCPVSHYGRSKRAAELIAEEYAARVPITVVRPPIVFGEGDPQMRNVFRSIFRYGVHVALGVAGSHYSLIHVDDLVDSLIACADRGTRLAPSKEHAADPPPGYYFVASDEQPTFAELGRMIGASLGRQSVRILRSSGPALVWPAAALAEGIARVRGRPYIFNFDKAREATAGNWVCSTQHIRHDVGFAPQVPVAERLRQTAEWYRSQNWL